jgi:hypothetical protein
MKRKSEKERRENRKKKGVIDDTMPSLSLSLSHTYIQSNAQTHTSSLQKRLLNE